MSTDFQQLLASSTLLGGLDPFSRTALTMHFVEARFAAGERILSAGAPGRRMLLILSGEVEVRLPKPDGAARLATLGPDQLLGEVAFFGHQTARVADADAVTPVVAAQLTGEIYEGMLQTDPGAAETLEKLVLDVMLSRIASTNQQVVSLVAEHAHDGTFRAEARMMARKL